MPSVVGQREGATADARIGTPATCPRHELVNSPRRPGTVVAQSPERRHELHARARPSCSTSRAGPKLDDGAGPERRRTRRCSARRSTRSTRRGFKVSTAQAAVDDGPEERRDLDEPRPAARTRRTGSTVVVTLLERPAAGRRCPNVVGETLDQARPLLQQTRLQGRGRRSSATASQPPGHGAQRRRPRPARRRRARR